MQPMCGGAERKGEGQPDRKHYTASSAHSRKLVPQQAIAATHMHVVPPLGLVLPRSGHLVLYVPGLHLLVVLESLPSPLLLALLIFRRLIAAD